LQQEFVFGLSSLKLNVDCGTVRVICTELVWTTTYVRGQKMLKGLLGHSLWLLSTKYCFVYISCTLLISPPVY